MSKKSTKEQNRKLDYKELIEYTINYIKEHPNDPKSKEMTMLILRYKYEDRLKYKNHKNQHIKLHESLHELLDDYIAHHPYEKEFNNMPLSKLMKWSRNQTEKPLFLK